MATFRMGLVGAGRMGRGIAHVFAYAGHPVSLIDIKDRPALEMLLAQDVEHRHEVVVLSRVLLGLRYLEGNALGQTLPLGGLTGRFD